LSRIFLLPYYGPAVRGEYVGFSRRSPLGNHNIGRLAVNTRPPESEALLTPAEVASMFRVDPKTVTRWAKAGKLSSIRTLGGHRRYRESEVRELLSGMLPEQRRAGDDLV
jgi:excisionase family DNA binding protein